MGCIGVCVMFLAMVAGKLLEPRFGPPFGPRLGLLSGLFFCLLICLLYGLVGWIFSEGGKEALKYNLLCWCLTREENIPWRYFHFLGRASDLLLLQQDGGTIRFRHLLLQDYFADLTSERIEDLAPRCRPRQSAPA